MVAVACGEMGRSFTTALTASDSPLNAKGGDGVLGPIFNLIDIVLGLYVFVIIIRVAINFLLVFGVLDYRNQAVRSVDDVCTALTEPLLRPIRRVLPSFRGIDLGPLVLLLLIEVLVRPYLAMFARSLPV